MPYKCCVLNCRGNYLNGPKVSVFAFPEDVNLLQKWLSASPRKDFIPTKNHRVCQLHFNENDIRRCSEFYDSSGKKLMIELQQPRLKDEAVPIIFPNCPSYLSATRSVREDPESKRLRLENFHIEKSIAESLQSSKSYEENNCFKTLDELETVLKSVDIPECFSVLRRGEKIMFLSLALKPFPVVLSSLIVNKDLMVSAFVENITLNEIHGYKFPIKVSNIHILSQLLKGVSQFCLPSKSSSAEQINSVISHAYCVIASLKNLVNEDNTSILTFIAEQLIYRTNVEVIIAIFSYNILTIHK